MPAGKQINDMIVLAENKLTHQSWIECEGYWTPKVGDEKLPTWDTVKGNELRVLMQKEHDRIFGIKR